MKNKEKIVKSISRNSNKDIVIGDSITANSQTNSATAKQPHGDAQEKTTDNRKTLGNTLTFVEDKMCGARTRVAGRCRKEMGWGTDHFGKGRCRIHGGHNSGAPIRNTNATTHGIYSKYFDPDEVELFNSQSAVEMDLSAEIALIRIELKRCYERASMQRDLAGGAKGFFQWDKAYRVKELDVSEEMAESEPPAIKSQFVTRDYGAIADRLYGRLIQLTRQQSQLSSFVPLEESLEILDFYLSEYEDNVITAKQVALSLAKFGIKAPSVIEIALKAEIEVEGTGDAEGLSDAELDAIVDQERAEAEASFEESMKGRDEIVASMMAGENIDLETFEDSD